ncbi:hypothetical protein [Psychroserpens ponticola]|uniref:DUF4375 domain-containing protein n=1 Tax=Psychroserpens ponticola TaxID=2932268 RepID=A0ABY7S6G6_9FLAO|nr:hypothetical protein [Psychroserpens ponticola]WCO03480.1 hypothetical protein MUN68_008220 [Psychroserpens ponticola]
MKQLSYFICILLFVTNCKKSDEKTVRTENSLGLDSSKKTCDSTSTYLTNFIFSTKKDVNIFDDGEYDDDWDEILDNAAEYQNEVLSLLNCSNITDAQKEFLISAMNGLSFQNYIEFISECFEKYKVGEISKKTLEYPTIFNNIKHRYYVGKYYQNEEVIELLTQIKNYETIKGSTLEKRIDEVLNGEFWKERVEFYSSDAMNSHTELLEGW